MWFSYGIIVYFILKLITFDLLGKNKIEKRDQNKKDAKHGWHAWNFIKNTLKFSIFKNNTIYTVYVPLYLKKSLLLQKFICIIFQSMIKERKGSG